VFTATNPSRTSGARVTFEPGARTAWHTHSLGQIPIVSGRLRLGQHKLVEIEEIRR
jgi:quercetin dioxygenase-like cupin family protein